MDVLQTPHSFFHHYLTVESFIFKCRSQNPRLVADPINMADIYRGCVLPGMHCGWTDAHEEQGSIPAQDTHDGLQLCPRLDKCLHFL